MKTPEESIVTRLRQDAGYILRCANDTRTTLIDGLHHGHAVGTLFRDASMLEHEAADTIDRLAEQVRGMKEALEKIATVDDGKDSLGFYILRDNERVLVVPYGFVQWRMDEASAALSSQSSAEKAKTEGKA
jgi:hypothetical protein